MRDETFIGLACRLVGGQAALATKLGVTPQAVSQWVRTQCPPPDRCPTIERVSDGRIAVENLRPDLTWHRIPDATWPHEKGRPLLDVTAAGAL